jgi:hypothetical protein
MPANHSSAAYAQGACPHFSLVDVQVFYRDSHHSQWACLDVCPTPGLKQLAGSSSR